jgi:membrane protein
MNPSPALCIPGRAFSHICPSGTTCVPAARMHLRLSRTWLIVKTLVAKISEDKIDTYAALMAYYFFFSLFPLLLFLAALVSVVGDREKMLDWVLGQVSNVVPPDAMNLVRTTVEHVVFSPRAPGILSLGILFAVWSGSGVFGALIDALNQVYEVSETRPWWRRQILRIVCLFASAVIVLVATLVLLNGESIVSFVGRLIGLGPAAVFAWTVGQIPLAIAFVVLLLAFLYWLLPNVHQNFRRVWVGALTATVLWLAATLLFRLYVQHFNAFNPAYGAVGAIMVLLTWMYYTMFVILLGGELNAMLWRGLEPAEPAGAT